MTKRYLKLISLCIISFALTACTNSAAGQSSRENDLALQGKTRSKILKNIEHHYYYSQLGPYQKENYLLLRKDSQIFKDTIHLAPDSEKI